MHSHMILSDVVADQVRAHRTRLGLNRGQLAEECARLGAPELTYSAITNIETGRRDKDGRRRREISVDELMTFGYALGVPPLLLALPLGGMDSVPSPSRWGGLHPHYAWQWVTGGEPPAHRDESGRTVVDSTPIGGDGGMDRMKAWRQVSAPAEAYRNLHSAQAALTKASSQLHFAQARHGEEADASRKARGIYLDRLKDFAGVLNEMTELGLHTPACNAKWVADMREFDLLDRPEAVQNFTPNSKEDKD